MFTIPRFSPGHIGRFVDRAGRLFRVSLALLVLGLCGVAATGVAFAAETRRSEPVRVAVYDVPPYGYVQADGAISGISVDLWRRIAGEMGWQFELTPVSDMDAILGGLEHGRYDAAIGAITITPDRAERVDFSYPAHRSGVAVAFRRETGLVSELMSYAAAAADLGALIFAILTMLFLTGIVMWYIERPNRSAPAEAGTESSVVNLRDGIYWAVVTMTTVGYGDKTPKTHYGRLIAIVWMLSSVVLVSLLSTSMVSRLTAERVESSGGAATVDLVGKTLAAAVHSSGAEYLDAMHLPYTKYQNLSDALDALANGQANAVVNSVGALQYFIANRYAKRVQMPQGLLAPAYMAVALPEHSALKKPIDRALMKITAGAEWRALEERFFGH